MRRLIATIALCLVFVSQALAQPLADRVPADAVVYVGWRGADDLGAGYKDSHTAAILAQSNFSAVFSDFVPRAILKIGQKDKDAAQAFGAITSIGGPLWRHPSAIFFTGLNPAGPRGPVPKFALVCNAGPDSATLLQSIQSIIAKAPDDSAMLHAAQVGDLVLLTTGYGENDPVLAGAEQPGAPKGPDAIGPSRTFANAMAQVQSDPMSIVYVDVERAVALIDEISLAADPNAHEKWAKVRDALGLGGLKRIIGTSGFDGKDFATQAFVEAPAPHKGITTLLDVTPVPDDILRLVPQDASTVAAGSVVDGGKLLETIRSSAAEVDPQARQIVDQGIGVVSMFVGKNLQTEILEPLGEHWVLYAAHSVAGRGLTGMIAINKLDDPKKAEQGINSLAIAICNAINGQSHNRDVMFSLRQTKIGDVNISYIATPLVTPAWAVKDGNLYVALYPENVAAAAKSATMNNGKSILDNPDFIAMRKRLNVEKPASISFIDMRPTAPDSYQMLLAISRLGLGFGDLMGLKAPEPVLPPLDVVMANLAPAGSVGYVDEAGWHSKTISPFPGAELLAGQQGMGGVAAPALALSVMLPALSKAKQQAQDVAGMSNLRQIALGCLMYASDHNGTLPPDLGTLLADGLVQDAKIFVSPNSGKPAALPADMPKEKLAEWVNKQTDYVYVGNGKVLKDIPKASEAILAYEKPGDSKNQRSAVAYFDGHCEILPVARLRDLLKRNAGGQQ